MDTELAQAYPGFGNLLCRLKEKLSNEGASPSAHEAFIQAQRELTKARSNYLTNKILYSELQEMLTDLQIRGQDHDLNSEEEKMKDLLCKSLAYAELNDYLHFCPNATSSSTLFGLTEEDIDRHTPVKMHLSGLIPKVEERLLQKCEDLCAYFDPSNSAVPPPHLQLTNKALLLPTLVEQSKAKLVTERKRLQQTRQQRDTQFWGYFQHLRVLCKVTCLKVRSHYLKVMCDTYTVESVKALHAVSGNLEAATSQARRELSATNQSLQAFRRLGPEFTALAQQVTQLKKELDNKKWGLQRFGQGLDKTLSTVPAGSDVAMRSAASGGERDKVVGNDVTTTSASESFKTATTTINETECFASTNFTTCPESYRVDVGEGVQDNSSNSSLTSQAKLQQGKKVSFR
ncbi:HAUS augmin-like complex subunit 4 [Elysia marginata]|uniref:HAUS augmin-like complex subunit 4 n=1 Tax=Elysia marginata TaxID=1093978 RepID=A0AAV4GJX5_9GAST|nr:HAUS augmin-like complex subunit 4 [Elysia marginata]